NAATTPPFFSVMREITDFAPWYSSIHRGTGHKSIVSSDLYEQGREVIKRFVNADQSRDVVIYTQNATESINMLSYKLAHSDKKQVVISTDMEHLANDLPWRENFQVEYAAIDEDGKLSLYDLEQKLLKNEGNVKLVTVTGASNVTGYINPIHQIARLAHQYGAQILVDGAQLVPHAPIDMKPYGSPEHIDYLVFSAHKMYAPFGIGVLIGRKDTFDKGNPVYKGGGNVRLVSHRFIEWDSPPGKDETGTPNVIGVAALIAAIETLSSIGMDVIHRYESKLICYAIEGLKKIPHVKLYCHSEPKDKRVSLISFNIQGLSDHVLAQVLSREAGIAVRNGLFCAHPYVEKLLKLSTDDLEYFHNNHDVPVPGLVRVSFGLYNNYSEIDILLEVLHRIARKRYYYREKYKNIQ
ncbi:MAG: aminotransferase class V-fold PLP-dependent enzyme, partial [Sporomusaceae bacterium]|nr:aminotransferase class V-fold PLP-dependent enzyme [Sporomusaceae bacterium]